MCIDSSVLLKKNIKNNFVCLSVFFILKICLVLSIPDSF